MESGKTLMSLLDVVLLLAILDGCWGQYGTWRRDRDMMRHHGDGMEGDDGEMEPDPNYFYIKVLMPNVFPQKSDQYLCTSVRVPSRDAYILNFKPDANMDMVHHMLLYGCADVKEAPGNSYDCGNMGTCRGRGNILYAWARNASQPSIPKGVGFHVGGSSGIGYVTLQVHYGDVKHIKGPDSSGLTMDMTLIQQPLAGGIYLLGSSRLSIPPGATNYHADIACEYKDAINIYPFAFRTHAHELSTVISGYRIRSGEWTMLGKGNPQWPQAFYPMDHVYDIRDGDILAARCTYNAEGRYSVTHSGGTAHDEMCNFYMMYYTDAINGETYKMCWEAGSRQLFQYIPSGSDTPPENPPIIGEKIDHGEPDNYDPDEYNDDTDDNYMNKWYGNDNDDTNDNRDDNYNSFLYKLNRITEPYFTNGRDGEDAIPEDNDDDEEEVDDVATTPPLVGKTSDKAEMTTEESKTEGDGGREDGEELSDNVSVVDGWPSLDGLTLGQVAGVAVDKNGDVHIFHRVDRVWGVGIFSADNHFLHTADGRIRSNTTLVFDKDTGRLKQQWGANMFFLPHGLTIDQEGNVWLTDVALHQVFKFPPGGGDKPSLTLGTELEPGSGKSHFCKPADVAMDPETGDIFVADGYCNSRIVKFSSTGEFIMEWGKASSLTLIGREVANMAAPSTFAIPHSLTFIPGRSQLCVADRENGRIQCFKAETGTYVREYKLPEFGSSLYAVNYSPWKGGVLYAINGPSSLRKSGQPVQGFTIDYQSGKLLHTWKPGNSDFGRPHDVSASSDFKNVYVVEIGPNKVWKFQRDMGQVQAPINQSEFTRSSVLILDSKSKTSIRIPNAATDASLTTTAIIVAVLAVPIFLMLLVAVIVRLRAQGRMRFFHGSESGTAIRQGYRATKENKFSLGNFFNRRKGFNQVSTEDSDHDGGMGWSDDSDVEEYSILNSKRTQNL